MKIYRIFLGMFAAVALGAIIVLLEHRAPFYALLASVVFGGVIWGGMALKSNGHLAAANLVLGAILLFVGVIGFYPAVYMLGAAFGSGINSK